MANWKMRAASVILTASMAAGPAPAAFAASATTAGSDIDGHWAQNVMEQFISDGLLNGDGDGNYRPNSPISRAEYAALLNRIMNLTQESSSVSNYTDVASSSWYYSDMAKALARGYMNGTSATTMAPTQNVTREQAFVMVARILGLDTENADLSSLDAFSDKDSISEYAKPALAAMVSAGYVKGSDGKLSPKDPLTRAEGVTVLNSTKDKLEAAGGDTPVTPGSYKDGVYTGTGAGYGGTMTCQVTIEGGKITDIQILSHSETGSYLTRAKTIIDKIINNQSTDGVDTVSGATKSSNGILTAVGACLSQAQGGADTSTTGSTGGGGGGSGNSTKTEGKEFDHLSDGVYEGSAAGYSGITKVAVTVEGGKITAIEVLSNGDTASYFKRSTAVIDRVIEKQSTDVDVVSGATWSSYGILNAVNDALKGADNEAITIKAANWSELIAALGKANDGDTIELTGDITDAGEDYRTLETVDADGNSTPANYSNLTDAVSSATVGMATINKQVTIDGNHHTIQAGDNMAFCFNISGNGVVMKNLTIDGASYGARMGGGLYLAGGHGSTTTPSLDLENVNIINCAAYKMTMPGNGGGAIYAKGSVVLNATDCTFENNKVVVGYGGAVFAQGATVTLSGCEFYGNTSQYGGAVAASGAANISVTDCTFEKAGKTDNDATYGGDDVYIFDGKTAGKANSYSDSAVSYALSGNTYSEDGEDFQDYAVVLGRYLEENESGKSYLGAGTDAIFLAGWDITFNDATRQEVAKETKPANDYTYVLMNIPYDKFYAADLENNSVPVDIFTSATKNKSRTSTLAGGSYHVNSDGSDITGITFPVILSSDIDLNDYGYKKVTDTDSVTIKVTNRGQTSSTTYEGKAALFENESYAYYELDASDMPSCYKVLTSGENGELSFGAVQGVKKQVSGVSATFMTASSYGDYQLNLVGLDEIGGNDPIYGVVIKTEDGTGYGLRHVENIWRGTELSWCTGFTAAVHDCPTDSEHYASMMGKTITSVTYYTLEGLIEIPLSVYVPIKFNCDTFSVADADMNDMETTVNMSAFPEDYKPSFTVTDSEGLVVENIVCSSEKLTWSDISSVGTYTLNVSDSSGKYSDYSTSFEITTSQIPVQYDENKIAVVPSENAAEADLQNYVKNITSVEVNGKEYKPSGRGAVVVIKEDGCVDLGAAPFSSMAAGSSYNITVKSAGYSRDLTFTVTIPEMLYGTATLTYKEFYSGDVTDASTFDAVSSATMTKNTMFVNADTTEVTDSGYQIKGVKNVNIAVTPVAYIKNKSSRSIVISGSEEPAQYKTINEDGTLSGTKFNVIDTVTDASAELVTGGTWGDYQINVTEKSTKYLRRDRQDDWPVNSEIQGIILETKDGFKVGMSHMENIWIQSYEVAFSLEGNANSTELAELIGKKVSKITYIMPEGAYDFVFGDQGVYMLPQYKDTAITGEFAADFNSITLKNLPEAGVLENAKLSVGYKVGRNTTYLLKDAAIGNTAVFELDSSVLKSAGEGGTYKVTISSDNYANIEVSIPMTEEQKQTLEALIAQADELLSGYDEASATSDMKALKSHREEAAEILADVDATSAQAAELIGELPELIELVKSAQLTTAQAGDVSSEDSDSNVSGNNEEISVSDVVPSAAEAAADTAALISPEAEDRE